MKNKKRQKGQKGILISLFLSILLAICGLYAYQYYWQPEINIKSIDAQYDRSTKANDMRINFTFEFKNEGKSKTKNLKLFTAFPKWGFNGENITASPYDFVQNDLTDLIGGGETNYNTYKDINFDDFIHNHNMSQGIWLTLVLRYNSDNLVYFGRTFEKHILIFLTHGMKENRMVFISQQVKERDFTHWFQKNEKKPNIFKIIEDLEASRLLYGDRSRFD